MPPAPPTRDPQTLRASSLSPGLARWDSERIAGRFLLALPIIVSVALLAGMGYIARRGLDVVDESYLLRIISDPQATRPAGEVYLFGFVLHPAYALVGGDIARLRLLGFVTVAALSAYLCREALALGRHHGAVVRPAQRWAAVVTTAGASTLVFSDNIGVPAYRSVAIVGIILSAAGLARVGRSQLVSGGALLGVGLWTCFVGKPTSAAALLVVVAVFALRYRLVTPRVVGSALASGKVAVTLTLVVAGMTPGETVGYLRRGVHLEGLLGAHPTVPIMLGWSPLWLGGLLAFGPLVMAPFVARGLRDNGSDPRRVATEDLWCAAGVLLAACIVGWFGVRHLAPAGLGSQVLSLALVLPVAALTWLLRDRWAARLGRGRLTIESGFVLFLVAMPYVSAVGSNLPFTVVMPLATVFWAVALMLTCVTRRPVRVRSGGLVLVLCLVSSVSGAIWVVGHHDGLEGSALSSTLQAAPVGAGTLLLPPEQAQAARTLRAAAQRHHITRETPVVDVTGVGAGYAVMTGGRPIGRAHMYSYLPHSLDAAQAGLSTATCDQRAAAWLIYAPGSSMDLSSAVTGPAVSLSADYESVAVFRSTQIRGTWDMHLLRPLPSVREKLHCS